MRHFHTKLVSSLFQWELLASSQKSFELSREYEFDIHMSAHALPSALRAMCEPHVNLDGNFQELVGTGVGARFPRAGSSARSWIVFEYLVVIISLKNIVEPNYQRHLLKPTQNILQPHARRGARKCTHAKMTMRKEEFEVTSIFKKFYITKYHACVLRQRAPPCTQNRSVCRWKKSLTNFTRPFELQIKNNRLKNKDLKRSEKPK